MPYNLSPFSETVKKPWGYELIFTPPNLARTGKLLHVLAGKRLSLQYHDQKEETLCLISGKALLWLEDSSGEIQKIPMELNQGYTVLPPQKHRIESVEDCVIAEVSMPETGTTFRLDDDYKRADETEEMRKEKDRGWQSSAL